jgi:hypothetical protein
LPQIGVILRDSHGVAQVYFVNWKPATRSRASLSIW